MSVKAIKVTDELKVLINKHEGRSNFALQTSISTAEKLLMTFDEYVRVEIDELNQQILLLETVRRDLKKEKVKIRRIQTRFNATHDRLKRISDLAKQCKITTMGFMASTMQENELADVDMLNKQVDESILEIEIITEAFKIITEFEELRNLSNFCLFPTSIDRSVSVFKFSDLTVICVCER
jgi:hypothetical protein